jgi:hypothetical protein
MVGQMRRHVMVLITVLLLVPSTASAVTTAVTSATVNGASRFIVDLSNPPTAHFTGTADVASVDLYCVSSSAGLGFNAISIANDVAVTSGAFATDAAWTGQGVCEAFAVPHGATITTNSDLTGLTALKVYPAYYGFSQASGKTFDYFVAAEGSGAEDGFESFGDLGMEYALLVQMHEYDGQPFDGNGYVESIDQAAGGNTPSMIVDNHPAYPPFYIFVAGLDSLPGWSDVLFSVADDAGGWRVTSHEGIYRCANSDAFPPATCTGFISTGVQVDLDEQLSPDARTIVQKLRFVSIDGHAHQVSAVLNQSSRFTREWSFPGAGDFQDYPLDSAPSSIAPAVATIRNRVSGSADPDIANGWGAITYAPAPSSEVFWNAGRYFVQRYPSLTVPAGKAVRVEFIYNVAPGLSSLNGQVAAAEAAIGAPPAITVTSPASSGTTAYTLTGTVNAPELLNAFSVNDQPVSVAGDGSFSVPETLAAGANQLTLKATDELTRTTTTPFTVTLGSGQQQQQQPPPGNAPLSVAFGRSGKLRLSGRALATGSTASCPGAGPDCSIAAKATANIRQTAKVLVVAKRSLTVRAGAIASLKITLSRAAAKILKRKHKLTLVLTLTGRRTGAQTTTAKRTIRLTAK